MGAPHDIVDDVLERLAARAGDAAFISLVDPASLRARADELEMLLRRGVELPLYGVPFAVKDNIDVAGLPTTAGLPRFAYLPDRDAPRRAAAARRRGDRWSARPTWTSSPPG